MGVTAAIQTPSALKACKRPPRLRFNGGGPAPLVVRAGLAGSQFSASVFAATRSAIAVWWVRLM